MTKTKYDSGKFITMEDIAKELGVSKMAVSKALKNSKDISEETKQKIINKANELGYIPNYYASSLKKGKSNIIALVFNDFYNPYFSISCYKVYYEIQKLGYQCSLLFCDKANLDMTTVQNMMVNKYCGVISFANPTNDVALFFKKRNIPFTLIGIHSNSKYLDCVFTDDTKGGKLVAQYFLEKGFKKPLYLTNSLSETSYRRFTGFAETLANNGVTYDFIPYSPQEDIIKIAYEKIKNSNIDFIFCFSDSLAIELHSYLSRKKAKQGVTIVGFDKLHKYYPIIKDMNSVDCNLDEVIKFACSNIVSKINGTKHIEEYVSKMFPVFLSMK